MKKREDGEKKKTGERVMDTMASLANQLSEAWHFQICRILVSFLTSRALSWPDGFPVCRFASPFDSFIRSGLPDPYTPALSLQISTADCYHRALSRLWSCSVETTAIELGESVFSSLMWSLIVTFKVKEKWQASTQTPMNCYVIGFWQNCSLG